MKFGLPVFLVCVAALAVTMFLPGAQIISGATQPAAQLNVRLWVSIIISFLILLAGLFVILSKKYPADQQNWAFASVGTVVGYWLPTAATAAN
jgi:hypothetical protein